MTCIDKMIEEVSASRVCDFCRDRSKSFVPVKKNLDPENGNEKDYFPPQFENWIKSLTTCCHSEDLNDMSVFFVEIKDDKMLGERNCRKMQFDYARYIFDKAYKAPDFRKSLFGENPPDDIACAIFVFADKSHHFRFSLFAEDDFKDTAAKRFRRYTFYVDPDPKSKNRTFKERMAKDWSSFLSRLSERRSLTVLRISVS